VILDRVHKIEQNADSENSVHSVHSVQSWSSLDAMTNTRDARTQADRQCAPQSETCARRLRCNDSRIRRAEALFVSICVHSWLNPKKQLTLETAARITACSRSP